MEKQDIFPLGFAGCKIQGKHEKYSPEKQAQQVFRIAEILVQQVAVIGGKAVSGKAHAGIGQHKNGRQHSERNPALPGEAGFSVQQGGRKGQGQRRRFTVQCGDQHDHTKHDKSSGTAVCGVFQEYQEKKQHQKIRTAVVRNNDKLAERNREYAQSGYQQPFGRCRNKCLGMAQQRECHSAQYGECCIQNVERQEHPGIGTGIDELQAEYAVVQRQASQEMINPHQ